MTTATMDPIKERTAERTTEKTMEAAVIKPGERTGFTGPIDLDRAVITKTEEMPVERSTQMSLNELIAYILGQEPTDDPRGINETLAHLACGLNNGLGDVQRQRLRPLAWELAGTFCWRCTFTRMDLLTALTAREMLSRILEAEDFQERPDGSPTGGATSPRRPP